MNVARATKCLDLALATVQRFQSENAKHGIVVIVCDPQGETAVGHNVGEDAELRRILRAQAEYFARIADEH